MARRPARCDLPPRLWSGDGVARQCRFLGLPAHGWRRVAALRRSGRAGPRLLQGRARRLVARERREGAGMAELSKFVSSPDAPPAGAPLLLLEDAPAGPPPPKTWPPLIVQLTPNVAAYPSYPWPLDEVYGTVIHTTRSGLDISLEEEWEHTLRYFAQVGSNFAHMLVGPQPGQWARIQRDDLRAWHGGSDRPACPDDVYGLNRNWRGIEVAEPRKGAGFTGWQYRATAELVVRWHTRDRLPLVHLRSLDTARS